MNRLAALLLALLALNGCMEAMDGQRPVAPAWGGTAGTLPTAIVAPPGGFPTRTPAEGQ